MQRNSPDLASSTVTSNEWINRAGKPPDATPAPERGDSPERIYRDNFIP